MRTSKTVSLAPFAALLPALALPLLAGCDDSGEDEKDAGPIVGVMELPISLRNDGSAPGAAPLVEISPKELRVDGDKLYDLDNGKLPDSATKGTHLEKLTPKTGGKGAKVRMHVNTSYETLALVAGSVAEGNGTLAIQVRKGPSAETGWLVLDDFEVGPFQKEPIEVPTGQRSWDAIGKHWQHMYDMCQPSSNKVDCDYTPQKIAEEGNVEITLFTRDNSMKLMFERFGGPDPEEQEEEEEGGGGGGQLLDGVRAPAQGEEEKEIPPATDAAFNWRHEEGTKKDSAITEVMKPLCGADRCGVVIESDSGTAAMRAVSFIGAVFPNGATEPYVHFMMPQR